MYNGISILIGTLIAIMIMFNGAMSKGLGNGMSLILIHVTGLATVLAVLLLQRQLKWTGRLDGKKEKLHWGLFTAGALGVLTVFFNNVSFLNIGMSLTLALGLFGQSMTSIAFDHFGLLGMPKLKFKRKKLIGLALILLGIVVMTVW